MANILLYVIALNLFIALGNTTSSDEIFIGTVVAAIGSVGILWFVATFTECGIEKWNALKPEKLYYDLNQRIYGQHLAIEIVFKAIKGHLSNKNPQKALALSFNGMAGTGKNLVSRIIVKNIYPKQFGSSYVKLFIASHEFKHKSQLENDKIRLEKIVTETVAKCPRSLFIFDEMEKMNPELIDVLKPFLSHYHDVKGVDYRKAIFIFMGNTGAVLINHETILNKQSKKKREDITIKQMDNVLSYEALKKLGGFSHSTLLHHKLIDYFIPFLPLEKSHVKKCIEDDLKEKRLPAHDGVIRSVLNELVFFPSLGEWFSESGCKKVSSKVDQYIG